jgi:hypothetical protein
VHQARQSLVLVQWIAPHDVRDETRFACFHFDDRAFVFIAVQANVLALAHQSMKQARELAEIMHSLDTADGAGFLLREFVAFPYFKVGFHIANEKQFAVLLVMRVRVEQQNRLLLFDAREIKQIR